MSATPSAATAAVVAVPVASLGGQLDASSEARWAAWVARGLDDQRHLRSRVRVALPVLAAAIAAILYILSRQ